jgi:hypothetical protein
VSDGEIAAAQLALEHAMHEYQTRPVRLETLDRAAWLTVADTSTARRMHAVIWYGRSGTGRRPVLTVRLATRTWSGSARFYRELLDGEDMAMHPTARREPRAPWLAVRSEVPLRGVPSVLAPAINRYPSVLAWAWIELHDPLKELESG